MPVVSETYWLLPEQAGCRSLMRCTSRRLAHEKARQERKEWRIAALAGGRGGCKRQWQISGALTLARCARRRLAHKEALLERAEQERIQEADELARRESLAAAAASEGSFRGELRVQMAERRALADQGAAAKVEEARAADAAEAAYVARVAAVAAEPQNTHEHHRRKMLWTS